MGGAGGLGKGVTRWGLFLMRGVTVFYYHQSLFIYTHSLSILARAPEQILEIGDSGFFPLVADFD